MKKHEEEIQNNLINKIISVSMVVIGIAYISAQLRAVDIGWVVRDFLQTIIVIALLILMVLRHKLSASHKAIFFTILLSLGALPGVYTLGIFAGTIFLFPTAAVIIAVFFNYRLSFLYIALSLTFCLLVAVRFSSGDTAVTLDADYFITSYYHWAVYITCLLIFFVVATVTIMNYRQETQQLSMKIFKQREALSIRNKELSEALTDVKELSGLLPICSHCKKIRDDQGYWNQLEKFLTHHTRAEFSHSICPECAKTFYPDLNIYARD